MDSIDDGLVEGFPVGLYPDPTDPTDLRKINKSSAARIRNHADKYMPPKYFFKVTPETYKLKIYKEYTLGDFDLDPRFMDLEYPRYIAIHPYILEKLDVLEQLMEADGHTISKFNIIYGYRSPAYNIGSFKSDGDMSLKEPFSTHMYGRAVDFIVDEDNDLVMDDLNGDGQITVADAIRLKEYVDRLDRRLRDEGSDRVGGAGYYIHHDYWERGEYAQSPYVHMDVRGFTSETGTLIRWRGADTAGIGKMMNPYRKKTALPPPAILVNLLSP